jgi:propionyl-CoA carboxylase alpha chain
LISIAASIHRRYMDRAASISGQIPGYEREVHCNWVVVMEGAQHLVEVSPLVNGDGHHVKYGGESYQVLSDWQFGQPLFNGTINGATIHLMLERRNMIYRLLPWGSQTDVMVLTEKAASLLSCMI